MNGMIRASLGHSRSISGIQMADYFRTAYSVIVEKFHIVLNTDQEHNLISIFTCGAGHGKISLILVVIHGPPCIKWEESRTSHGLP